MVHSSTLPAHRLVVSQVAFLEACSPSVHLVSKGARSLPKTTKNCGKSLCWDRLQKYQVVMDQNASTPPQKRYRSAQTGGAVNGPRAYKSFKYKLSIYRSRAEEFQELPPGQEASFGRSPGPQAEDWGGARPRKEPPAQAGSQ